MGNTVAGLEEGSVLMSIGGNVILRLNGVGTLIWQVLEEGRNKGGLELRDVLEGLVPLLEGCLAEPIPRKRVKDDVSSFLDALLHKNLIEAIDTSDTRRVYLINRGIFWSRKKASDDQQTQRITPLQPLEETFSGTFPRLSSRFRRIDVLGALLGLVVFDLFMKIYQFDKVHRILERQSLRSRSKHGAIGTLDECKSICEAVDKAQVYYYKQILCLQRSAVAACLLWLRGIPAELIIAARLIPFQSHAWVEVGGEVVNDRASVRDRYDCVIERIGVERQD
jgi:hypothetical protein